MHLKLFTLTLISLWSCAAVAQRPASDEIKTEKGSLIIQPIRHSTLVLMWDNKIIYIDPDGGAKAFIDIGAPDIILITDIHGDHMNVSTLQAIETSKAVVVAPKAVGDQLPEELRKKLVTVGNGEKVSPLGIDVKAVPMYNLPEDADSRHTKGRGNGYVITLGGKNIYISGDTEDISEMRTLSSIDIAFVCMNMPYTMDINQAASAVLAFKPKIVYPFHYRGSDTEAFKKLVNEGDSGIEVRLRNWYPN